MHTALVEESPLVNLYYKGLSFFNYLMIFYPLDKW